MALTAPVWGWPASYGGVVSPEEPVTPPVVTPITGVGTGILTPGTGIELWPSDLIARACDFHLRKNSIRNASPITQSMQVIVRQGSIWRATYTFRNVGNAFGRRLDGILDRGYAFQMWDHSREQPENGYITGVTVSSDVGRGHTTVLVSGLPANVTHIIPGDYLGINGKLYRSVTDAPGNAAGEGVIYLNRGLLGPVVAGTAINFIRPTATMVLQDEDQTSRTIVSGYMYEYTLAFVEMIE